MSLVKKQDQVTTPGKTARTRFVETLVDEQDYWMSLTDAARVTRTSEAMARRWVSSGRLPVKQEPVGINQRTRLVRASDVALIRPIVDPTAAITDQIHKMDLLSIPRQQIQITEVQGRLLELTRSVQFLVKQLAAETHTALEQEATHLRQLTQSWDQRLSTQSQTVQQVLQFQQQQHEALAQQVNAQTQAFHLHAEQLNTQVVHQQQELEHIQILLPAHLATLQQQVERLDQDQRVREDKNHHDYTVLFQQHEIQFRQALQGLAETLTRQEQEHEQVHQQIASLERSFGVFQHTINAQVEQYAQEIHAVFEQRWRDFAEEKAVLTARIENLERQIEQMCLRIENVHSEEQKRAQAQDQQMQTLALRFQHEIDARQTLQARFDTRENGGTHEKDSAFDTDIQERA